MDGFDVLGTIVEWNEDGTFDEHRIAVAFELRFEWTDEPTIEWAAEWAVEPVVEHAVEPEVQLVVGKAVEPVIELVVELFAVTLLLHWLPVGLLLFACLLRLDTDPPLSLAVWLNSFLVVPFS